MAHEGAWTEQYDSELRAELDRDITEAHESTKDLGTPPVETLFDDVYEELPWNLREQKEWLMRQARTKSPHYHH